MAENIDYDQLVKEKNDAESRVSRLIAKRDQLSDTLNRLKDAKTALNNCCDYYSDVKRDTKKIVQADLSWKGEKYSSFSRQGNNLVLANQRYYDDLDAARDAINMKIAHLQDEIASELGLLGDLYALINDLTHKIENYLNG